MATKKPTPPRRTLEKLHEVGKNYTDIARRFGVSRTTVKNWFKEYGIYSPPGGRVIEPPTLEALDKLIAGGMSGGKPACHPICIFYQNGHRSREKARILQNMLGSSGIRLGSVRESLECT